MAGFDFNYGQAYDEDLNVIQSSPAQVLPFGANTAGFDRGVGMVVPGAATNLLPFSQDFSDASWTKSFVNISGGEPSPDEGTGAFFHVDIKGKIASLYVTAQEVPLLGLSDSQIQALDGQGVLGPYVDVTFISTDGIGSDGHAFQ